MPYELEVQVSLRQVGEHGEFRGNERLTVNENATLPSLDFSQVADVLQRFHALTQSIKGGEV